MSTGRGRARVWVLVLAVLQLAATPALAIADGMLALRNSGRVVAHAEGHSSEHCKPPHSAECALCQFLSSQIENASAVAVLAWPTVPFRCRTAPTVAFGQRTTLDLSFPRAPPVA